MTETVWRLHPYVYTRRPTREVKVGDVGIGGDNPIRVQSMTTPATSDVGATVSQIVRLVEAGCEIVRVTVPTSADARALPEIRRDLASRGIRVPLVADIHFSPGAALKAVEHVEKIRVNPGNYADRKQFVVREYSDAEYDAELNRLEEAFRPLVLRAKQLGVAMRIGTNHGSLSDRIMNRYGDSPLGMVESALEFVRICEAHGYRDLVISMKASNPVVTIQAYRLLAARMADEGMDYPFHLGVTEAGDGEDGRIKSAIGIGSLLADGIGDTVRVSLTEDPTLEIPVALRLVDPYNRRLESRRAPELERATAELSATGTSQGRRAPHGASLDRGPVSSSGDPAPPGTPGPAGRPPAPSRPPSPIGATEAPAPLALDRLPFDLFTHSRRRALIARFGPCEVGAEQTVRVEVRLRSRLSDSDAVRREIDAQTGPRVPIETRAELVEVEVASDGDLDRLDRLRDAMRLVAVNVALSARPIGEYAVDLAARLLHGNPEGSGEIIGSSRRSSVPPQAGSAGSPPRSGIPADRLVVSASSLLDAPGDPPVGPLDLPSLAGCPVLLEGTTDQILRLLDRHGRRATIPGETDRTGPQANPRADAPGRIALSLAPPRRSGAPAETSLIHEYRRLVAGLAARGVDLPIVLSFDAAALGGHPVLAPAAAVGSLLCDGIGDSVSIVAEDAATSRALAFNILQGARVRISKTEFISCPSCGRTLFDLEETTRRIKERTAHLKGLKIAVMGCVVNGPGEMADADFGYVGWGTDKIALFVGKEIVARDIPTSEADDRLVALIKEHGKWQDPPEATARD